MALWDGVEEFLAVAETGSFTAGAARLGVSASHVSRQVARLEDRLGVKLFARSTRVVRLTDAGGDYFGRVSALAEELDEANQAAAGDTAELSGRIRVTAAGPFAEERVAPALARFMALHPKLSIELDFNTRYLNLIDEGFDFAVRLGDLPESGLIARRLVERPMICLAARAYLKKRGAPAHPRDLRDHACIVGNSDRWTFADPDSGEPITVRVGGRFRANNMHAIRAALREGLGIAYMTQSLGADLDASSGELVRILEGFEQPDRTSWIVYPERRHLPRRVRAAMDFLVETLG